MERRELWGNMARAACVGVMAAAMLVPAAAWASDSQTLTVTATVLKRATLQVLHQPAAVVVTQADLARGYVDVPASAQLAIYSNTRAGYLLDFASVGDFMRQILVSGLGSEVQLSPSGGLVRQNPAAAGVTRATLTLGFRFMLSDVARPGTYAWPMRVSVAPI